MRVPGLLLSLVLVSFWQGSLDAATIHVPADQPTIQAGIDAAVDGDTVLVADGTYTGDDNKNLDFVGKAIVLMSENGPENCVIDCEQAGRGFHFYSGEGSNSVVQGFTITNGFVRGGGGIRCQSASSPTIRNNIITANTSDYNHGGGIHCINSSPVIENNTITGNLAFSDGGGIHCNASSPTIIGNTISGNNADHWGGGIFCGEGSSPSITDNLITGNEADYGGGVFSYMYSEPAIVGNTITGNTAFYTTEMGIGGGIYSQTSSPTIVGNTITGNTAVNAGGGIGCWEGSAVIENNTISGNTTEWGGALSISYASSTINRNVITENTAEMNGGGVDLWYSSATMTNNTIAGNTAGSSGGGMDCLDDCAVTITNTIFWDNDAPAGNEISIGYYNSEMPSTVTICYSDVQGGEDSVFVDEGCSLNWLTGMIDDDPCFVVFERRDCRLLWESPCVDAGHPSPQYYDADGTVCDIGACCFDQDDYLTLYVTPHRLGAKKGGRFHVTYTVINRGDQPEPFWCLSQVLLPGGAALDVLGPDRFTVPAHYTAQIEMSHPVPQAAPTGACEYWSRIGVLPSELYDEDSFTFWIVD